jgi:hypothetical protein
LKVKSSPEWSSEWSGRPRDVGEGGAGGREELLHDFPLKLLQYVVVNFLLLPGVVVVIIIIIIIIIITIRC